MFNRNGRYFHTDIFRKGSYILYLGQSDDGFVYFARQNASLTFRPPTAEEVAEGWRREHEEIAVPHPIGPVERVGPHNGFPMKFATSSDGAHARIDILDGFDLHYSTTSDGTTWEWRGSGKPPKGFWEIFQNEPLDDGHQDTTPPPEDFEL